MVIAATDYGALYLARGVLALLLIRVLLVARRSRTQPEFHLTDTPGDTDDLERVDAAERDSLLSYFGSLASAPRSCRIQRTPPSRKANACTA